jgi:hypothetical protein
MAASNESGATAGRPAAEVADAELSCLGGASSFDRSQINLEQGLMLFALLLVLLSQSDDLAKDLNIEAVALGFLVDLLLGFV